MLDLSGDAYMWLKALHLISVIAWMAGLLYLPRLFVYHTQVHPRSQASELFKIMERRLLRAIMHPSLVASWLFGGILLLEIGDLESTWLWIKVACAFGLLAVHLALAKWRMDFAEDRNEHSEKFYRVINEVPTVLMIAIVVFAVIKPF